MTSRLTYIPCQAKPERCLIYIAKCDRVAESLLQLAFGKSWHRSVSVIFGWDGGENDGRALEALATPARRCRQMYVITDLSWRGLLTASRAIKLCRPSRAKFVGINDQWLPIGDEAWVGDNYRISIHAEDLKARLTAAQRRALLRHLDIGPACRALLADGQEVHLEAFGHDKTAKGLRRLLRSSV